MEKLAHPPARVKSSLLNRLWRIFATALGFIVFGLGGLLILSTLWFTLLRLTVWNKTKRNFLTQKSIQYSFKFFLWLIKTLGAIDYHFEQLEKLQQDKGCLVIANHPSLLDFVLLASVMPRCDCMVKESLLKNIFVGGVIRSAGYIPNTAADKLLPLCRQKIDEQGLILIFPEGTRSIPGQKIRLQRGAANIALRCQIDIRLIHIECQPPMLTKQQKWYNIPPIKPTFTIRVGEKIDIQDFMDDNLTLASRKLTYYLTEQLEQHN